LHLFQVVLTARLLHFDLFHNHSISRTQSTTPVTPMMSKVPLYLIYQSFSPAGLRRRYNRCGLRNGYSGRSSATYRGLRQFVLKSPNIGNVNSFILKVKSPGTCSTPSKSVNAPTTRLYQSGTSNYGVRPTMAGTKNPMR
jgi:hypothetical protein